MKKKTLVVLGHPDSDSYCSYLAQEYVKTAKDSGRDIRAIELAKLEFDPVLHHGYKQSQLLEPGLQELRESITWAEHLVFFYPIWWGAMPALMKGAIDRTFLPGFAFQYRKNSQFWDRLLSGRSAHLFTTMDTPPWYYRWVYKMPGHHQMKKTILEFSGVKPVKINSFGPVRHSTAKQRMRWVEKVRKYAACK